MRFSLLSILVTTQIAAWCVLGTYAHGWQILLYPLAWAGIATSFIILNYHYDRKAAQLPAETFRPRAGSRHVQPAFEENAPVGAR